MIYIAKPNERRFINQGKFIIRMNKPGLKLNNPDDLGLGPLGRVDHATLEPGILIKMHPHRNDEILSYMRRGTMIHEDSEQNKILLHSKYMMMMNAGSGIQHEESVLSNSKQTVELLQIFVRPSADDLNPLIQFHQFDSENSNNAWRLVAGPENMGAPLKIRNQVWIYDVHLNDSAIKTPELNSLTGYLYVFDGKVIIEQVGPTILEKGTAILIKDEALKIKSNKSADLVFFVLDEKSKYSRSGTFSG